MGIISIKPTVPIILASASKIRAEILKNTGLLFSVKISDVNEDELKKNYLIKASKKKQKFLHVKKLLI